MDLCLLLGVKLLCFTYGLNVEGEGIGRIKDDLRFLF